MCYLHGLIIKGEGLLLPSVPLNSANLYQAARANVSSFAFTLMLLRPGTPNPIVFCIDGFSTFLFASMSNLNLPHHKHMPDVSSVSTCYLHIQHMCLWWSRRDSHPRPSTFRSASLNQYYLYHTVSCVSTSFCHSAVKLSIASTNSGR